MWSEYPYRPATIMVGLIFFFYGIGAAFDATGALVGWRYAGLLTAARDGQEVEMETVESVEMLNAVIGLGQSALFLAGFITFLVWINRANKNARALGAGWMRFTPGWSIGWFFVPIMNLFRPYQVVQEIWRVSDPDPEPGPPTLAPMIGFWWVLHIVSGIASQASFRMSWRAKTLDEYVVAAWVSVVSDAIDFVLAPVAIAVVWSIHSRQQLRSRRLADAGPPEVLPAW
jgi:hypothetical protein